MTATEKTLFDQVLENFQNTYPKVKVEYPYNDAYMLFTINGGVIDGLNTDGYNLLYCLNKLTKIYSFELC